MKHLLALLLAAFLGACGPVRNLLDSDEQLAYDKMLVDEVNLKQAVAAGDTDAQIELDALQLEIAKVEGEAIRRSFGPVWGTLSGLPIFGQYFSWLGPFASMFLVPLFTKRGRRNYLSLVRNVTPWVPDENGQKGVAIVAAANDLLCALGKGTQTEEKAVVRAAS